MRRIQLSRARGWRKPEGAIVVARPSKWGNPFKVGEIVTRNDDLWPYLVTPFMDRRVAASIAALDGVHIASAGQAVECYQWWFYEQPHLMLALDELVGHDLACWCSLDAPCHADVLLDLVGQP